MSDPTTSSGHIISIPPPPPPPPPPRLPYLDLIQGSGEEYIKIGVPLYEAASIGDWKAAKHILDRRPDLVRFAVTENFETLLHVAASAERCKAVEEFVVNLLNLMAKEDLQLQNKNGDTAFSLAAQSGNIKTAKTMLDRNPGLVDIPNNQGLMPLYMAALFAKAEMARYLYDLSGHMCGDYWDNKNRGWVLQKCVESEIFDVAIKIVMDLPKLTDKKGLLTDVLLALAQNNDAFKGKSTNAVFRIIKSFFAVFGVKLGPSESEALQLLRIIWRKIAKLPKTDIDNILRGPSQRKMINTEKESEALPYLRKILEKLGGESKTEKESEVRRADTITFHPSRVLFVAAKTGNVRFITEFIRLYPGVTLKVDDKERTIFHQAIKHRNINIYKLIYEIGAWKELITPIKDKKGNYLLHMIAKYSNQKLFQGLSGAAFQMQRELLWFKEVEKIMPTQYRKRKNKDGKTPQALFTETHVDLLKAAEEWMKTTASQCMVVATLIATIVFAAAFTLPGGYNQDTGIPFFRKEPALIIFVIADAISLISSSTSVLMFLSIFTSRFAEKDFLVSLPRKLVNGIATLFLSVVTMMIAFSASFFVLYNKKVEWLPITITGMASIPVIVYLILQNDLFKDVYQSAYQTKYIFKHNKRVLYSYS